MARKAVTITSSVIALAVAIPITYYGYLNYGTEATRGGLSDDYIWTDVRTNMSEPMDDFETIYIQKLTGDIGEAVDTGSIGTVMLPESVDVFKRPEDKKKTVNTGTTGTINSSGFITSGGGNSYSNRNTTTTTVNRVPKAPSSSSGAPSGQWCVYVGANTGGVPAFNASLFPKGTASTCKQIYDAVTNGRQGDGRFKNINELNEVCAVFTQHYGITVGLIGEGSKDCVGYFPPLSGNRVSSASYAEKIVQQLFPNGATANQVVQGVARWICNNASYNINLASANDIFTRGMGNCNAYASAFKQMVNAMGIQCDIVAGTAYGVGGWGPHAWNMVYINGVGYHVDVCYADTGANWNYILSTTLWGDHTNGVVDNAYFQ